MQIKSSISLEIASGLINQFKSLSLKDKKRFAQCFNCKHLDTCHREEESEFEDGTCKFFEALPKKEKPEDFVDVFNREMQRIVKEEEGNA